jgi:tRNA A37 threonylcarbamoyladenosine biosynthesis protein TsaE
VPYRELDALRFKAELEVAQRELEDLSKKAGIAELEWEDQRKQLLATSTVHSLDCSPIQFCS